MFRRSTFPHMLTKALLVILAVTLPSLAQHAAFHGGGSFQGGGDAIHGGKGVGGVHQDGIFNTLHSVNHFRHGRFGGYYYASHHHHGGYYGLPYYYGGYYGYPWSGGFNVGFGFGTFWGFWGHSYGEGYYPLPYPYYPYISYRGPSHAANYWNDSSPEQNRESSKLAVEKPSRCDYRYENTCNDEQPAAAPSNVRPLGGPPDVNYVSKKVHQ